MGSDAKIIAKTGHKVDVAGIDGHTINDLEIVSAAGLVQTTNGPYVVIKHQMAYHGQGKTIHCSTQMEAFGHEIHNKAFKLGGKQCLTTPDGITIPFAFRNGLPYIDMRPPTDFEFKKLPHVILTADNTWDPSTLNHEFEQENDFASSPSLMTMILTPLLVSFLMTVTVILMMKPHLKNYSQASITWHSLASARMTQEGENKNSNTSQNPSW